MTRATQVATARAFHEHGFAVVRGLPHADGRALARTPVADVAIAMAALPQCGHRDFVHRRAATTAGQDETISAIHADDAHVHAA